MKGAGPLTVSFRNCGKEEERGPEAMPAQLEGCGWNRVCVVLSRLEAE